MQANNTTMRSHIIKLPALRKQSSKIFIRGRGVSPSLPSSPLPFSVSQWPCSGIGIFCATFADWLSVM